MSPKLPFDCPGGDMYLEHNLKPTPTQVELFLLTCDLSLQGTVMWVHDYWKRVPELWNAFCDYKWDGTIALPPPCSSRRLRRRSAGGEQGWAQPGCYQ